MIVESILFDEVLDVIVHEAWHYFGPSVATLIKDTSSNNKYNAFLRNYHASNKVAQNWLASISSNTDIGMKDLFLLKPGL